jgi:hypothetical protein
VKPDGSRFDKYVYDYLVKRSCTEAAKAFAKESGLDVAQLHIPVSTHQGFLYEWWTVFWDIYSAKNPPSMATSSGSGSASSSSTSSTSKAGLNGPQTSKQLMAYLALQTAMDQKNANEYKSRKMAEFRYAQQQQQQSMMNGLPASHSLNNHPNAQKRQMMEAPHAKLGLIAEMEAASQNSPLLGASPALKSESFFKIVYYTQITTHVLVSGLSSIFEEGKLTLIDEK